MVKMIFFSYEKSVEMKNWMYKVYKQFCTIIKILSISK